MGGSSRQQAPLAHWLERQPYKLGVAGSIPAGRICSRHGEPAPEDSTLIAVSGYREKIAAGIPARECVDGQQVFCGFLM